MPENDARHVESDSVANSSDSLPFISLGREERKILREYLSPEKIPTSMRGRAQYFGVPRSTLYDIMKRLISKKLLVQDGKTQRLGVTQLGRKILGETPVGSRQAACLGPRQNLSQHFIRFELYIKDRSFFRPEDLNKIGEVRDPVPMKGWQYYQVFVDGDEIRVFPNTITIYVGEVMGSHVDETQLRALDRAANLAVLLEKVGLHVYGMKLDASHYERVGSILGDALLKNLGKYYYELPDKRAFWVDFSGDKINDESNDPMLRARVDQWIESLSSTTSDMRDVDKLRDITGAVVTDIDGLKKVAHMTLAASQNLVRLQIPLTAYPQPLPKTQAKIGDYIG